MFLKGGRLLTADTNVCLRRQNRTGASILVLSVFPPLWSFTRGLVPLHTEGKDSSSRHQQQSFNNKHLPHFRAPLLQDSNPLWILHAGQRRGPTNDSCCPALPHDKWWSARPDGAVICHSQSLAYRAPVSLLFGEQPLPCSPARWSLFMLKGKPLGAHKIVDSIRSDLSEQAKWKLKSGRRFAIRAVRNRDGCHS